MTDKYGVGFFGIEFAIGLIGHGERTQRCAAIEHKRSVAAKLNAVAGKITDIYNRAFTAPRDARW
jgi:hypothetical protein